MKKTIIIGVLTMFTIVACVLLNILSTNGVFERKDKNTVTTTNTQEIVVTKSPQRQTIIVEIKGEVLYPGVYEFSGEGVIVSEVIRKAGGLTDRADISSLNTASIVTNHSSIVINTSESKSYILKSGESLEKININTCSKADLESLPGIGSSKAQAIIDYRNAYGFFESIEELKNVQGISDAIFEKIKGLIKV